MKKLFAVLVLMVLAAATVLFVGCGDDTVTDEDVGVRARVTMTADKTAAAADGQDKISLKLVAKDGSKGPEDYRLPASAGVVVVVYDKHVDVTQVLVFEKLDEKAQDAALAAFAKVLVDDPPKDEKK